ncbi:hypothetical protein DFJ65_1832 [Calidifontibacter indicus]|uniref:DUF559 domain-containing protein n=2 Tax=Calidifontibacter indicus TaxID=419650 RepID=A0A3D9UMY2_9MICO|nr:hypothetical protein DFJ65_1832 [Calidifontibacter indicus]
MTSVPKKVGRAWRAPLAEQIAATQGGVVHRSQLRSQRIGRDDVRAEVAAGRWQTHGKHTVAVLAVPTEPIAAYWTAVWESGSGALLDGPAALIAAGMTGFEPRRIDVALLNGRKGYQRAGVRIRRRRELVRDPTAGGPPRVPVSIATIHAAQWAVSDRQAALLLCLPIQQRLLTPNSLAQAWHDMGPSPRREVIASIIADVSAGAHSLGELDFGGHCLAFGIPEPARQVVRDGADGRAYLDAGWDDIGLVVEIDGGHHQLALSPIDDALRQNDETIRGSKVLRIPVVGLRVAPDRFMKQVASAYWMLWTATNGVAHAHTAAATLCNPRFGRTP